MTSLLILSSEFPPFRGGIATYSLEIAKAAVADGYDVTVVAPDYHADNSQFDRSCSFDVVRFPGGPASLRGLASRMSVTRRVLRDRAFDIVHAADWPFFIPVRLFAPSWSRVLLTLHGTEIIYMGQSKRRNVLSLLRFWRSGWAEWIANSYYTLNSAISHLPISRNDIRAVTLGVSDEWLKDRHERDSARAELNVTEDRLVLVSLGRVVVRKGHGVLADALSLLPPELVDRLVWWIIGPELEPDHAAGVRAKLERSGVDAVWFGNLPFAEVKLRLAASDLFCLPGFVDEGGRVEGFGLVFLEAAAQGVPSVGSLAGGVPEAIDDGVTGLLVPEKDPAALADALGRILEDGVLRREMAIAARLRAERSSWTAAMKGTYSGHGV